MLPNAAMWDESKTHEPKCVTLYDCVLFKDIDTKLRLKLIAFCGLKCQDVIKKFHDKKSFKKIYRNTPGTNAGHKEQKNSRKSAFIKKLFKLIFVLLQNKSNLCYILA